MWDILGYTDADYANNKNDRVSFTGYLFKASGELISWTSHKQHSVATSSMVAEYIVLSDAAREAEARRQLYIELGLDFTSLLLSDNQAALTIADEPSQYQKIKHVDVRYHHIRHQLHNGRLFIDYIPSNQNPADALTKALTLLKHR